MKNFLEFVEEKQKNNGPITSTVVLGDGNDFQPFMVSDDQSSQYYGSNASLAPIIRAFKKGGNWGWSKDDKTGEDKPIKIGTKKLFLIGGSVRDHLAGKKPRNMELATNASPDEIYHILKQNEFEFGETGEKCFWVLDKDKKTRPFKFGVKVKNDQFELSVFSANSKGVEGDFEPGTQEQDAEGRDFTINAMALILSNDNGPNKNLQDFYGGINHLKSKQIVPIGDMEEKIKEDPVRALRYARMLLRYGDPNSGDKEKETVKKLAPEIKKTDKSKVQNEFMKIFSYPDGDTRGYLKTYNDLGLTDQIFPGMNIDRNLPKELSEMGDKHMPLAWMLRNHFPQEIQSGLKGFDNKLVEKLMLLIKTLAMREDINADELNDLKVSYLNSDVSSKSLKEWAVKVGKKNEKLIESFIQYIKLPKIKMYLSEGSSQVTSDFTDLVNGFGELDLAAAEQRKKELEHKNFLTLLKKNMPNL